MDIVLGSEWLMQLGNYTTNLEEQFTEFNWKGQHYKLYSVDVPNIKEGANKYNDFTNTQGANKFTFIKENRCHSITTCLTKENHVYVMTKNLYEGGNVMNKIITIIIK